MKIVIMQPYFMPYIGYFQLLHASDTFVLYDNIQYTKKGWINRNRIIQNNNVITFTIPIKKDSDYLNIWDRQIADSFKREKLCNQIMNSYRKAPCFDDVYPIISELINSNEVNLFKYISESLIAICKYLNLNSSKIKVSSEINIDHSLKSEEKVLAICNSLSATEYINPIGGIDLYSKERFASNNIDLKFLKTSVMPYDQFDNEFYPNLSIVDTMMFNPKEKIQEMLNEYELL